MSALLENGHMSDLMKSQGFAAISFWFDGKEHQYVPTFSLINPWLWGLH